MKTGELILVQSNNKLSEVLNIQYNTMPTIEIKTNIDNNCSYFMIEKDKSNWLPFNFIILNNLKNKIFKNEIEKIIIITNEKNLCLLYDCKLDVKNGIIKFQKARFID